MTQGYPPPLNGPTVYVHRAAPTNVLGVIGFVLVMVGLIGLCFTPALLIGVVGTILCLVGVFREPRGLAIAGLVVGLIETLIGLAIVLFIGTILGGAAVGLNAAVKMTQTMQTGQRIRAAVEGYERQNGMLPSSLASVAGLTVTRDAWGHSIRYAPNSPTTGAFDLISDGPDGKAGTADDMHLDRTSPSDPTTAP